MNGWTKRWMNEDVENLGYRWLGAGIMAVKNGRR